MLCQNCSKREATTHIKRVINGDLSESHLCSQCAKILGYDDIFDSSFFSLPDFFAGFFGDSHFALPTSKSERCEKCGCSFDDIIRTGMVGCAQCYEKFYEKLQPSLARIHGRVNHTGKTPPVLEVEAEEPKEKNEDLIKEKKELLKKAIEEQNFEYAAVLRDEIKALEEV